MRLAPKIWRNWSAVKNCTSALVSNIMPVQPSTIVPIVTV